MPVMFPSAHRTHARLLDVFSHTVVAPPPKLRVHALPTRLAGPSGGPPRGRLNSGRA